jgi:F0F1-type ATP synthase assembly protein I
MRSAGSYELVLSALLFAAGGWFIDGWLGTRPLVTCLGVVLGFAGACASLYYRYKSQYAAAVEARLDAAARSGSAR